MSNHFFNIKNFIFENFIVPKFCLILFDFSKMLFKFFFFEKKFGDEQCSFSDSETALSQKLVQKLSQN